MLNNQSIRLLIRKRYSCRSYQKVPVPAPIQSELSGFLSQLRRGPMGSETRYELLAANEQDRKAIVGLTTYGFIKNPTGYILGAVKNGQFDMEDFGYMLEYAVLYATSLDLGTVWLGGTFNKGRFAKKMKLSSEEQLPAVIATGLIADSPRNIDAVVRRQVNADNRKSWSHLFFKDSFDSPLATKNAGAYAEVLEMMRCAPSASNKQPWRVIKQDDQWHFYLMRNALYRPKNTGLVGIADMQRIDMGIAMCHFELTAKELDLPGHWEIRQPSIDIPNRLTTYMISWVP